VAAITDTRTFDQMWAHVRTTILPRMENTWYEGNPLLRKMERAGSVILKGGRELDVRLEVEEGLSQEFDGYEVLTTVETDPFKGAKMNWAYLQVPIVCDRADIYEAKGPDQIADLQRSKTEHAKRTMRTKVSKLMFDTGTHFLGLKSAVPYNGDSTGTYANINRATYSWWRNNVQDCGSAYTYNSDGSVNDNKLINHLSTYIRKATQNDLENALNSVIITGNTVMGYMEKVGFKTFNLVQEDMPRGGNKGDLGLVFPVFRGLPILVDDYIEDYKPGASNETGHGVYILNLKYLKWYRMAGLNFTADEWRKSDEQFSLFTRFFLAHQLFCTNPRFQTVIYGIDAPAAA